MDPVIDHLRHQGALALNYDKTYTASLRLTQSGLARTIQADAVIFTSNSCLKCV